MQHGLSHHRFPHRPPHRAGGPGGLINLVVAVVLGVIVYRKGIEEGKKLAESQKQKPEI
jgi:hypothetical protein